MSTLLTPDEIRQIAPKDPVKRAERVLHHAAALTGAAKDVLGVRDDAIVELLARGVKQSAVADQAGVARALMLRYRGRANTRALSLGLERPFPEVADE